MPKTTFSSENKVVTNNTFPTLSLDYGERALIVCVEAEPTVEYVHQLEAPEIGPDGRVLKETRKNSKGEEYQATVMEFFGQHLCFGDFEKISAKGVDPESCPTCAAAVSGEGLNAPKPRYAMHVLKYATQPGTWQLRDPYNVDCVAWVFAANRFNTLIDLAAEWGNLQKHDLKLGPCESKKFQKYDIQVAQSAQWIADDDRKKQSAEVYAKNQSPDLSALIARKIDKSKALEDIARVQARIEEAYGRSGSGASSNVSEATQSVTSDINEILAATSSTEAATEETAPPKVTKELSIEDIMADL